MHDGRGDDRQANNYTPSLPQALVSNFLSTGDGGA